MFVVVVDTNSRHRRRGIFQRSAQGKVDDPLAGECRNMLTDRHAAPFRTVAARELEWVKIAGIVTPAAARRN